MFQNIFRRITYYMDITYSVFDNKRDIKWIRLCVMNCSSRITFSLAIQFHQTVKKVLHLHFSLYTNDVKLIDMKQFQFELCTNRSCTKLICKFHVVKNGSSTQEIPFGFHVFGEMFGLMHFCQKYIKFALIHYQIFNIVETKNGLFFLLTTS